MITMRIKDYTFERLRDGKCIHFYDMGLNEVMRLVRLMCETGDIRDGDEDVIYMYNAETGRSDRL